MNPEPRTPNPEPPILLLATAVKFWFEDRGDRRRIANLCRAFRQWGFRVHIFAACDLDEHDRVVLGERWNWLCVHEGPAGQGPRALARAYIEREKARRKRRSTGLVGRIRRICRIPPAVDRFIEPRLRDVVSTPMREAFAATCAEVRPSNVVIALLWLAYLADAIKGLPVFKLIDTLDVAHQRCTDFHAEGERHWANISERDERAALRPFDGILAIQENDAAEFRRMLPGARVIVAGDPGVLVSMPPPAEAVIRVGYLASGGHSNQRAIEQFLRDVWPRVRDAVGTAADFHVFGSVCDALVLRGVRRGDERQYGSPPVRSALLPPGVVLHGTVANVEDVYAGSHVIVNPVGFGGGLKKKNTEALCHGRPLITTPVGAEGLEAGAGSAFLVARSPEEFAEQLIRLVKSDGDRQQLAQRAMAFAAAHLTEDAMYAELKEAVGA